MNNDTIELNGTDIVAKQKKKLFTAFLAGVAASFVLTVLYCLSFALYYEKESGYFARGAFLPVFANIFLIICVVGFIVVAFLLKPQGLPGSLDRGGSVGAFAGLYAGFVMLFEAIWRGRLLFIDWSAFSKYFDKSSPDFASSRLYRVSYVTDILTVLFCVGCAAYFVLLVRRGFRSVKNGSVMGLFPVVRALLGVAQLYFDVSLALNSPSKLLAQFAMILLCLYFLAETRYSLPEPYARPRYYFVFALAAMVSCAAAGFPLLLLYFKNSAYFASTVLVRSYGEVCFAGFYCLTFFIYILMRFPSYVRSAGIPSEVPVPEEKEDAQDEEATAENGPEGEEK